MSAKLPPFRADQVGSLLRPPAVMAAREAFAKGTIAADDLAAIEDDAIRAAVRMQEDVGFEVTTDGEFRRESWNRDFLLKLDNVKLATGRISVGGASTSGQTAARVPTSMAVTGKLARSRPIFVEHFKFLKRTTKATPKLTIPSPTILHFRGGREAIDNRAYPDLAAFYADAARAYQEEIADLEAAGCRYIQIDDVNFAYLCDPRVAAQIEAMGEDPKELPRTYARLINDAISKRRPDTVIGLHMCRGNAPSGSTQGGYDAVADVIFNEIDVPAYFMEFDSPRAGSFEPLRLVPKAKTVVLGLVSTKVRALESADEIRRRINEAARFLPLDQLALSTQCGFSSGASTTLTKGMTEQEQRAKLLLVVDVARREWG